MRPAHPRLPEVDASHQLPHDEDVHTLHQLTLEGGGVGQLRGGRDRIMSEPASHVLNPSCSTVLYCNVSTLTASRAWRLHA